MANGLTRTAIGSIVSSYKSLEQRVLEAHDGPWKSGNEFLPYHPSASHVPPDHRDGWNRCWLAARAAAGAPGTGG